MVERLLRGAGVCESRRAADARRVHDARRLSAVALGDSRRAARLRHARRRRLPDRPQSGAADQGRRRRRDVTMRIASRSARSPAIRFRTRGRQFFSAMAQALSLGLDHPIEIATPFLEWEKEDVIRRGVELGVPLELTLSCMNPGRIDASDGASPQHCGLCSKCRERRDAFAAAGVSDPSTYANSLTAHVESEPTRELCLEQFGSLERGTSDFRVADDRGAEQADRGANQRDRRHASRDGSRRRGSARPPESGTPSPMPWSRPCGRRRWR